LFPDREFFMRSQGQVRFIKISSRLQIGAARGRRLLLLAGWSRWPMAISQFTATRDRLALLDREAKVATAESRVSSYRKDLRASPAISQAPGLHREDGRGARWRTAGHVKAGETVSDSRSEAARTVDKVSARCPKPPASPASRHASWPSSKG
jgi:hypothetical protein